MAKFSPLYKSFRAWAKGKRITRYFKDIVTKHEFAPNLTLKELRLASKKLLNPAKKGFTQEYRASINALYRMRSGSTLKDASKVNKLSTKKVLQHIKKFLYRKRGRYLPKEFDTLQRPMMFFENGTVTRVVTRNSRDATKIAQYLNAVRNALRERSTEPLKIYKGKYVTDVYGNKRYFETDLDKLEEANEAIEQPEFSTPYRWN